MDRKKFISDSLKSLIAVGAGTKIAADAVAAKPTTGARIGYEHLPKEKKTIMKTIVHRAESRGHASHGWLDSHHTFSFANYYDPSRMNFGALRVLNDDIVDGGMGFGEHAHDNMEIVSIPLQGDLEHKDSTGRHKIIQQGDVQIMSAGRGIRHSEYNHSTDKKVNFLQVWILTKERDIEPRYDQKAFAEKDRLNKWQVAVAPDNNAALWINQDAWFSLAKLEKGKTLDYTVNKAGNGVYLFVIEGEVSTGSAELKQRDGIGIYDTEGFSVAASTDAYLLAMEVPMNI